MIFYNVIFHNRRTLDGAPWQVSLAVMCNIIGKDKDDARVYRTLWSAFDNDLLIEVSI